MSSTELETVFIGRCFEGFFFGLFSGIFALYIQNQASKIGSYKMKNIIFYALCALYLLSIATLILDTRLNLFIYEDTDGTISILHMAFVQEVVSGCSDFIAQSILIYRCWIVWGYNIRVVIGPSVLAIIFIATWQAAIGPLYVVKDKTNTTFWSYKMTLTSLAISLTVNTLVTGLIVFRISQVYRKFKPISGDQHAGFTSRSKLRSIIFVLIESGMTLFGVQVARVLVIVLEPETEVALNVCFVIAGIHKMLNGITPTIILVRVAMGLSFYDEESMTIETIGSLHFATEHHESIQYGLDGVGMELDNDPDVQIIDG